MSEVYRKVYKQCKKAFSVSLVLDSEAYEVYKVYHNQVVEYRKEDLYEEDKLSVQSKSTGIMLRLFGVLRLLSEAVDAVE